MTPQRGGLQASPYILEFNVIASETRRAGRQRHCIGGISDPRPLLQQGEHGAHVGQGLARLAVHRAQEVEGHGQLGGGEGERNGQMGGRGEASSGGAGRGAQKYEALGSSARQNGL